MKLVRQTIFAVLLAFGLAFTVMAQKGDQRKPPPKDGKPPVINPGQKPPRDNPPRDNKPKKPGMEFALKPGDAPINIA